jgi:paired amphipathic helix protein Sin3a
VLYSRLIICKEVGAHLAAEKYASLLANSVAQELGLDEPSGSSAVLQQAVKSFGERGLDGQTNVLYAYLLDACEQLFDGEMEQATFEEHMRWFFGTKVGSGLAHVPDRWECGLTEVVLHRRSTRSHSTRSLRR